MGLYRQPNDWTCGPLALKHALVALGRLADEQAIARLAKAHWWSGTDEVRLARAARAFDCDLPMIRRVDEDLARRALVRYLRQRIPVLLCVDDWEHWITAVHYEKQRFVVIDSRSDPVLHVLDWPHLRTRWRFIEDEVEGPPQTRFDLHPVKPRFRVTMRARFSVARAQFLRRPENLRLARHWDEYLSDLLDVCRPRSARARSALSMGEFLRRHQDLLMARVLHWHGGLERDEAKRLVRNFRFVAETYGLEIPNSQARRAIADVAMLLALFAAALHGVAPLYGSDEPNRSRRKR